MELFSLVDAIHVRSSLALGEVEHYQRCEKNHSTNIEI